MNVVAKAAEPLWAQGGAGVPKELAMIGSITKVMATLGEYIERHFRTGFVKVASARDVRALLSP